MLDGIVIRGFLFVGGVYWYGGTGARGVKEREVTERIKGKGSRAEQSRVKKRGVFYMWCGKGMEGGRGGSGWWGGWKEASQSVNTICTLLFSF